MTRQKQRKVCKNGHVFFKSSDCNSCPTCDKENKPESGFLATLSAPARRALIHEGITTEEKLADRTKKEILALHGIGPASMPALMKALEDKGLIFKAE
ncbi:RNA polymerase alpha subunit C-terminal domain-containing protein [Oceanobacillus jeddahense]|uniref:RNA polymerase alpha subunit C-terminal domain-containing protein n=1 Tax=Oceanobacillus jeddahense TaxID=1462527 RepID=A0ABY5JLT9_9BACI|nr:RNA polymerase alpha subunit C-terminal domain-containing protein [Oceanobacillus jeddahense]UUI01248.1 RNA polymerase alpha subunit C-terminal domain-containing protein [Oceanobacillus jeddahense]